MSFARYYESVIIARIQLTVFDFSLSSDDILPSTSAATETIAERPGGRQPKSKAKASPKTKASPKAKPSPKTKAKPSPKTSGDSTLETKTKTAPECESPSEKTDQKLNQPKRSPQKRKPDTELAPVCVTSPSAEAPSSAVAAKKPRGRPKKSSVEKSPGRLEESTVKKPRGRPRKSK